MLEALNVDLRKILHREHKSVYHAAVVSMRLYVQRHRALGDFGDFSSHIGQLRNTAPTSASKPYRRADAAVQHGIDLLAAA